MDRLKAYPKIVHLGTKYAEGLFDQPVEVTEKVDGSQLVFGRLGGEVLIRSKGAEIFPEKPPSMFRAGVNVILGLDLPNDIVFYGEYLSKPKHNVLAYKRAPENHIVLFGVSDATREILFPYENIAEWAKTLGLDVVPLLYEGKADTDLVMDLLERESFLGGPSIEGIVVKNYKDFLYMDRLYPVQTAKFVSEKFKEVHTKTWATSHTSGGRWVAFIERYRTEARWQKAVQHLVEANKLEREPRDIGTLIKEVQRDITEEEKDIIKGFLWEQFGKDLLRRSTAGLPEWYKEQLARGGTAHK